MVGTGSPAVGRVVFGAAERQRHDVVDLVGGGIAAVAEVVVARQDGQPELTPSAWIVAGAGGLVQLGIVAAAAVFAAAAAMGCEGGPCGTRPIATDAGSLKTHHRVAVLVLGLNNPARLSHTRWRRDLDLAKLPR